MNIRIGHGYDVHKLVSGRKLILGGIRIPHKLGLQGHSDADVLVHAIMDALLSSVNQKDIGVLFPNTDPQYLNISSLSLLRDVVKILKQQDASILNISCVIHAEKPKIAKHIDEMILNISRVLEISKTQVSISATTHEGIGAIGRCEGIAASVVALVALSQ